VSVDVMVNTLNLVACVGYWAWLGSKRQLDAWSLADSSTPAAVQVVVASMRNFFMQCCRPAQPAMCADDVVGKHGMAMVTEYVWHSCLGSCQLLALVQGMLGLT
jgi:hypothetical protein